MVVAEEIMIVLEEETLLPATEIVIFSAIAATLVMVGELTEISTELDLR